MINDDEIINSLNQCPTIYHTIRMIKEKLIELNYTELPENLEWTSIPSKFFIIYKNKNIIAFNNKENSKGNFFIGNMKPNFFHIEKNSQFPTLDYNFCRIKTSYSKLNNWNGRAMRVAGHIYIQDEETKEVNEINIFPKKSTAIFPSKQEINFISQSPNSKNTLDFLVSLSRDSSPFINDFPGPIIKMISDELKIPSYSIQNPDLYLVDSKNSYFVGTCNVKDNRIISGQNISQLCPTILAFNSFIKLGELTSEKFASFILYDESDLTNSFLDDFMLKLLQKIDVNNDSIAVNIIPVNNEKTDNKIFIDTSNDEIERFINSDSKYHISKIKIDLQQNLNSIINSISQEVVKLGIPISNFESPQERVSLSCLKNIEEIINKIIIS